MNSEISNCCKCYGLYDENNIVGFCAVLHQPHGKNKKIKRCSRIVILPDYQGIGLGYKMLTIIAEFYKKQGFDFTIVTSAKNFINKLSNDDKYIMVRYSSNKCSNKKTQSIIREKL